MSTRITLGLIVALFAVGCGGDSQDDGPSADGSADAGSVHSAGIGPVEEVDTAMFDAAMAAEGAGIFEAKCTACHKMEERYVGPPLKGVTNRRTPAWIVNMILAPDKMVQQDPEAKKLLAEYIAPMTNQNLTESEAKKVLAYFLEYDRGEPE
jgi:mono/diheme cytochrome c family protein